MTRIITDTERIYLFSNVQDDESFRNRSKEPKKTPKYLIFFSHDIVGFPNAVMRPNMQTE